MWSRSEISNDTAMAPGTPAGLSQMSKEVEEKIFAPSCELHFSADRPLIGVSGQDVEGDAAQDGKILWSVILAGSGIVLVEGHIEAPMTLIFDAPIPARHFEQALRR